MAAAKLTENRVVITGTLIEHKPLRYTPAGVPVSEGRLRHESEMIEAGHPRKVECEVNVVALGTTAKWLQGAGPGKAVRLEGFLALKSKNSRQPMLHVERIEFLEGNENGSTVFQEEGR